jgi:hypothetical protein
MANQAAFAPNPHGVRVKTLDFTHPQAPSTKTWHGITIVVAGNVVGRITSWNPSALQRDVAHVYELNVATYGHPVDVVPGKATGFTIAAQRIEVWTKELELALGFPAVFADLTDQNRPFEITEMWFRGNTPYRIWVYTGCWFSERNEDAFTADGDTIVRTNPTIYYVNRIKTLG